MAGFLVLLPAFFSAVIALSGTTPLESQVGSASICGDHNNDITCELQQMKLKISHLESTVEKSIENLNAKNLHLTEQEKLIEEMEHKIHSLQTVITSMKGDSSNAEEKINALEEKVQLLWDESRKNNFNLHILESKAQDAEKRLQVVASQVEKMRDIVTEQWIQIQQLEQALQIAVRNLKVQRKANSKCTFLKVLHRYSFAQESLLSSYTSQALLQLKKTISAAKKFHHELQGYVKQEMERNKFTAILANEEVVFFVASAIIVFPIMGAWTWLSSCFS